MNRVRNPQIISILILSLGILFGFSQKSHSQDTWTCRNPIIGSVGACTSFNSVAFGSSVFVAVGNTGSIYRSSNGTTWTIQTSGVTTDLQGITFGNSLFVAVGKSGTILTSSDGSTWTKRSTPLSSTKDLNAVTYDNTKYVVVGDNGTAWNSDDAVTWTARNSTTITNLNGVASSGSIVVAVGNVSPTNPVITTSTNNGDTWSTTISGTVFTSDLNAIVYNGTTLFVAVGDGGVILTSTNGTAWSPAGNSASNASETSGTSDNLFGVSFGSPSSGSIFTAFGVGGRALSSSNGTNWTLRTSGTTQDLKSAVFASSKFVTVGINGVIGTSSDGESWSIQTTGTFEQLEGIVWNGSKFVTVGAGGTVLTSSDGISWTKQDLSPFTGDLKGVDWNGTRFVTIGANGAILSSTNATTWTTHPSGDTDTLLDTVWNGSLFATVGNSGTLLTSSDGVSWSSQTSPTSQNLHGVTWSGSKYLLVGATGTVVNSSETSLSGFTWTSTQLGTQQTLTDVVYNGTLSQFAAVSGELSNDPGGKVLTSTDGTSWTIISPGTEQDLNGITWSGTRYVAVGDTGEILSSTDGTTWSTKTSGTGQELRKVIQGNNLFVAVGAGGTILTSPVTSNEQVSTATPFFTPIGSIVIPTGTPTGTVTPPLAAFSGTPSHTPTPTPFFIITINATELANTQMFFVTSEFLGVTVIVKEIQNVPLTFGGHTPSRAFSMKISELSGCSSGITVSIPVPANVATPHVVVFIDDEWVELTTTISDGKALGTISCSQLTSARSTDIRQFGFRAESGDILVGLADQSELVTPSLNQLAGILLVLLLTVFMIQLQRKSDSIKSS